MKMIAPNIAMPIAKPIAFATLNTRERKSVERHDRLGGAALPPDEQRRAATTPATPRPTIVAEPQAYSLPPQVVSRISAPTPPLSSAAPR